VAFHPTQPKLLFTGSVDEMVYVLDPTLGANEDDATVGMFNIEVLSLKLSSMIMWRPSHEM